MGREPGVAANVSWLMAQRDLYIDRLRTVMTVMVILHHAAITYGAPGGWFWTELKPSAAPSSVLLTLFVSTNQAYFMGVFFLLAGYFTPASLERKGYARFIADRFLRLGVPLLAFGLILGPATVGIVNLAQGYGFWSAISYLWRHKEFINGPLWFAQALLIFSLVERAVRLAISPAAKLAGLWAGAPAKPTGRLIFTALAQLRIVPATTTTPATIPRPPPLQARLLELLGVDPRRPR